MGVICCSMAQKTCLHCETPILAQHTRVNASEGYLHHHCHELVGALKQMPAAALVHHNKIVSTLHAQIKALELKVSQVSESESQLQTTIDELVSSVPQSKVVLAISEALNAAALQEQQLRAQIRTNTRMMAAKETENQRLLEQAVAMDGMWTTLNSQQEDRIAEKVKHAVAEEAERNAQATAHAQAAARALAAARPMWLSPTTDVTDLRSLTPAHHAWTDAFGVSHSPSRMSRESSLAQASGSLSRSRSAGSKSPPHPAWSEAFGFSHSPSRVSREGGSREASLEQTSELSVRSRSVCPEPLGADTVRESAAAGLYSERPELGSAIQRIQARVGAEVTLVPMHSPRTAHVGGKAAAQTEVADLSLLGFVKLKSHVLGLGISKTEVDKCMTKDKLIQLAKWGQNLEAVRGQRMFRQCVNVPNLKMSEVA